MPKQLFTVEDTTFVIMMDNTLTSLDRKVLTHLYQPIIGDAAINIYSTLYTMVESNLKESDVTTHTKVLSLLNMNAKTFVTERIKLEAVGLLDTYYKDNLYAYVLKTPKTAYEFFRDEDLAFILRTNVGKDMYERLTYDFLLRKLDLKIFHHITCAFDDVFDNNKDHHVSVTGVNTTNNGIQVNNEHFNMESYLLMVKTSDAVAPVIFEDLNFLDLVARLAFLYNLNPAEMKDATILSVKTDGSVDLNNFRFQIKRIYEAKASGSNFVPRAEVVHSNDETSYLMETLSPNEICKNMTGTSLTSFEVAMFDSLLEQTGVSIGVLNAVLVYVLKSKGGEIPNENYFLKILNTIVRSGINNSKDTMEYLINGLKPKTTTTRGKRVVSTPDWYKETKNEIKPKTEVLIGDDITDFFKDK